MTYLIIYHDHRGHEHQEKVTCTHKDLLERVNKLQSAQRVGDPPSCGRSCATDAETLLLPRTRAWAAWRA